MSWEPEGCILVPVDLSDFSMSALDKAIDIANDASQLYVIHVLQVLSTLDPGGMLAVPVDDEARRQRTEQLIEEALRKRGCAEARVAVLFGDPANEIARFARDRGAGAIVIHSHGRTGAAHLLIGSVAERVVRYAHCPVLVLRD